MPAGRDQRRARVAYDPFHFDRLKRAGRTFSLGEAFRLIHEDNLWRGPESVSGEGSGREQTRAIVAELPELCRALGVRVLLDAPCGVYAWIDPVTRSVERYIGADVVPEVIAENTRLHGDDRHSFVTLDLTVDPLPPADLILCRDCLVHLSFDDASRALRNVAASSAAYLLVTTFTGCAQNEDIVTGDWRPLNLRRPPFEFPEPVTLLDERSPEASGAFPDKSLGLWRVAGIRRPPS